MGGKKGKEEEEDDEEEEEKEEEEIKEALIYISSSIGFQTYGQLSYFSFQPVLHDWCNKGRGMCYPVCGMVHIKEPLLLIDKSSLCGGSGFPFSLTLINIYA